MKFDPDLLRKILEEIESFETDKWRELEIEGYSPALVKHHVEIMGHAIFAKYDPFAGPRDKRTASGRWVVRSLTLPGHEFLAMARNDTAWNRAKAELSERGIGFTVELMTAALTSAAKSVLGIS